MQNKIVEARFLALNIPKGLKIYVSKVHGFSMMDAQSVRLEIDRLTDYTKSFTDEIALFFFFKPPINDDLKNFQQIIDFNEWAIRYIKTCSKFNFIVFNIPMVIGYLGIDIRENSNRLVSAETDNDIILNKDYFEVIEINDLYDIVNLTIHNKYRNTINIISHNTLSLVQIEESCFAINKSDYPKCLILENKNNNDDFMDINIIAIKSNPYYLKNIYRASEIISRPKKLISIVVPTYNEERGIEEFYLRLKAVLNKLSLRFDHEIIFVNDCSNDLTLEKLLYLQSLDNRINIIDFARNFGNQSAIAAGLDFLRGDLAVIIDDDLQDPPEVIFSFIAEWERGSKVVYGQRPIRDGGSLLFKFTARWYYKILTMIGEIDIPPDTGDFRLIDRQVIDILKKMHEPNKYYRGMIAWVGFSQKAVFYRRDIRYAGLSTFSLRKYISFALNGLTSFSDKPLYLSSAVGMIVTFSSFIFALILVMHKIFNPETSIRGWTSLFVLVSFFGGIQLLTIGILGIYISQIFRASKGRPFYIISKIY